MTNMNDEHGSGNYSSLIYDDGLIVHTHSCPKITNDGVPLTNKNISVQQCLTRAEEKQKCVNGCEAFAEALKK